LDFPWIEQVSGLPAAGPFSLKPPIQSQIDKKSQNDHADRQLRKGVQQKMLAAGCIEGDAMHVLDIDSTDSAIGNAM